MKNLLTFLVINLFTITTTVPQTTSIDVSDPDIIKCEDIGLITYCYNDKKQLLKKIDKKKQKIEYFTNKDIMRNSYFRMSNPWYDYIAFSSKIKTEYMYKREDVLNSDIESYGKGYYLYNYIEDGTRIVKESFFYDSETGEENSFNAERDLERIEKEFDSINTLNPQPIIERVILYDKRDNAGYPLERKTQIGKNVELLKIKYQPKTETLQYRLFLNGILIIENIYQFNDQNLVSSLLSINYNQGGKASLEKIKYTRKGLEEERTSYTFYNFSQVKALRKDKGDDCFFKILFNKKPEKYLILKQGDIYTTKYNKRGNPTRVNIVSHKTKETKQYAKFKYDLKNRLVKETTFNINDEKRISSYKY